METEVSLGKEVGHIRTALSCQRTAGAVSDMG